MAIKDSPEMPRRIRANVSGLIGVVVLTWARRLESQGIDASDGDGAVHARVLRELAPAQELVCFVQTEDGVVPPLPFQSVVAILDHDRVDARVVANSRQWSWCCRWREVCRDLGSTDVAQGWVW